jgi:CarD family transcriptional regulator
MMFQVSNCVMYGRAGVCKVIDIKSGVSLIRPERQYYILHTKYANDMTIMTPVDNHKVTMRNLASRQEVVSLIDSTPKQVTEWIDDDKLRTAAFTETLDSGRCEDWIKLIKAIQQKSDEKIAMGKKLSSTDEGISKEAKKLLHEEFAESLEISSKEVESYILKRTAQQIGRSALSE